MAKVTVALLAKEGGAARELLVRARGVVGAREVVAAVRAEPAVAGTPSKLDTYSVRSCRPGCWCTRKSRLHSRYQWQCQSCTLAAVAAGRRAGAAQAADTAAAACQGWGRTAAVAAPGAVRVGGVDSSRHRTLCICIARN